MDQLKGSLGTPEDNREALHFVAEDAANRDLLLTGAAFNSLF
jgi:hypothetical protein